MAVVTLRFRLSTKPRMGTRTPRGAGARRSSAIALALVADDDGQARDAAEVVGPSSPDGLGGDELVPRWREAGRDDVVGAGVATTSIHFSEPRATERRHQERLQSFDHVEPLDAEGVAGADDRGAVVRDRAERP